jgi:serine/threonine protein kinase
VDGDGFACISDYGLEIVLRDEACTKSVQANVRWMAPEVLGTKNRWVPSGEDGKTADIYSFGMVMFEVCLSCLYSTLESVSQRLIPRS